ncbi:condensation domain-containing protein [Paraburkholderia dinghuensis]|uniref:Condensation protein n=1 Tax=Paraburkholderia dinghuensis TaxID=2305225 RepID=A0A3N6MK29_9BURK|nr:condensation domain-containing protein [Paraburkholderia dinghuensis]RQH04129.1 condensation protein [Paraburkholderia dinghuensis]
MNGIAANIAAAQQSEAGPALFPATACQVRLWHEQKVSPSASALNIAFRLQLSGPLNAASIERVLGNLVARHEILRTGFLMTGAGLRQQVWSHASVRLEVIDLTGFEEQAAVAQAERVGGEQARTPFELSSASFFRAVWLPRSNTQGELQLTFHSLVMDGWSFAILVRELVEGLAALRASHEPEFPEVDLHYGDYALWKGEFLSSGALDRARDHWRQELEDFCRFDVPGDRPRPQERRFQGVIRSILLPVVLGDRLIAAAKAQGVTLFSVAAASLATMLRTETGQTRVAMSTQMSVRDQQELESVVGPLINTVILRIDVPESGSLAAVIAQCGTKLSEAIEHLHVPFEEMIEMAGEVSDISRPPLCSVNFALQQSFVGMGDEVRRNDFGATTSPSFNAGALYDLNFFMVRRPEGWRISCEGDTDLYDVETIDRYLASWREVLETVELLDERSPASADRSAPGGETAKVAGGVGASGFMSQAELAAKARNIVRFNENAPGTPVIALNNTAVLYGLAQQIAADRPLIDIPMVPEGAPREFPQRAFQDITADAVRLIRLARPRGPYILMGHCVLGAMSLEAAHQLRREGETVELVILVDSWCPGYRESMPWYDRQLRKMQVRADNIPRDFRKAMRGEISMVGFLKQYRAVRWLRVADLALRLGLIKGSATEHMISENRWYIEYLLAQQTRYRPALYDGDVQIFRSDQALRGRLFAWDLGWGRVVTGKPVVTPVPGMHDQIFRAAGAAVIGKQLRERLSGIQANTETEAGPDREDAPAAFMSRAEACDRLPG